VPHADVCHSRYAWIAAAGSVDVACVEARGQGARVVSGAVRGPLAAHSGEVLGSDKEPDPVGLGPALDVWHFRWSAS
jgi:hypothetical protein